MRSVLLKTSGAILPETLEKCSKVIVPDIDYGFDDTIVYYIDINTIEDLREIRKSEGCERFVINLSSSASFNYGRNVDENNPCPVIEIYNDYRE